MTSVHTKKTNVLPSPHAWYKSFEKVEWRQSNTADAQQQEKWVSNVNVRYGGSRCRTCEQWYIHGTAYIDLRTEFWHRCTSIACVLLVVLPYFSVSCLPHCPVYTRQNLCTFALIFSSRFPRLLLYWAIVFVRKRGTHRYPLCLACLVIPAKYW